MCIHPDQVPVVNRVYGPDPDEVVFAQRVIEAFAGAERAGSAAITVDGFFVDYPIVYKAERIVALADAISAKATLQESARA
jgi:citrate lyase subunit beta/citryl-CoA lyase